MTRTGRVSWVVGLTALGLLVLLWGASTGDPLLVAPDSLDGRGVPTAEVPVATTETTAPFEPVPTEVEGDLEPRSVDLDWAVVVGLALVMLVVGLVVRFLLAHRDDREPPVEVDELDTLVEATADPAGSAALAGGDPRNAVVACWVALEDGVARAGLERSPAETSVDLARRVLGTWQVEESAVTELSELYREARFSRHPVTEQQRTRATSALARINTDLRAAAERRRADRQTPAAVDGAER
jgi:Domain of unknown function (DUF4129)